MALPSNVTEAYLQGSNPGVRKFWKTVATRAPVDIQHRVCELRSEVSDGKCVFRDRDGEVLHETPDPPPPVEVKSKYAQAREMRVDALEKRVAIGRDLGLSNADAIVQIAEMVTSLIERIQAVEGVVVTDPFSGVQSAMNVLSSRVQTLETKATGMQAKVDREGRGIHFRGSWQQASDYDAGSMVTHGNQAYVAVKSITSGGVVPSREGSGWCLLFNSKEVSKHGYLENVASEVAGVIREVLDPVKDRLAALENEIALRRQR